MAFKYAKYNNGPPIRGYLMLALLFYNNATPIGAKFPYLNDLI